MKVYIVEGGPEGGKVYATWKLAQAECDRLNQRESLRAENLRLDGFSDNDDPGEFYEYFVHDAEVLEQ